MVDLSRRALIGGLGVAAVGTAVSAPRLVAADIPGRRSNSLSIAMLGTAQDAAARQGLIEAFNREHPDIPVRVQAIQGQDWSNFFAKILTLVAAGTPPDVCVVATEGTQLFAERLAAPLDDYLRRDRAQMQEYFDDVHPSLMEAFLYKGSVFQLPVDFNAANLYYNTAAFTRAGLQRPADDWTWEDFRQYGRQLKASAQGDFRSFFWTNRLWGGVVPWLYTNSTSVLKEKKASGGDWFWRDFYSADPTAAGRGGGYLWEEANAEDPKVAETFEFLQSLVKDGLASNPAQGGGGELVARFAANRIGMTPAGGFWVQGLSEGGMRPADYDVTYFPRQSSQRHQFGAAGYTIMKTSERKDEAWEWIKFCASREGMGIALEKPNTTPTRRSMLTDQYYAGKGPAHWKVFYETLDKFPTTGPIPAPPQQAAVETALIKNVLGALTGDVKTALATMQRDLTLALRTSS